MHIASIKREELKIHFPQCAKYAIPVESGGFSTPDIDLLPAVKLLNKVWLHIKNGEHE